MGQTKRQKKREQIAKDLDRWIGKKTQSAVFLRAINRRIEKRKDRKTSAVEFITEE